MEKLYYPESIAIVGLSSKSTNIPRLTLENLLRWGYRGRIFGVNPRSNDAHVDGIKMYRNLEDLPEVPDLAYCMVPAKFIPDIVTRCGKLGIPRMAIPSGGFAEFSEGGRSLAEDTLQRARHYGIRLVGPNSVTVANTDNGLCLPFVSLYPVPQGGMSIISQSGGVALTMLNYLMDEQIGLAKFASIGNKLDLDEVDFLEYFGRDPQTQVICMYLESLERGKELVELVQGMDKPVVVYKANTTSAGKAAAMSHTAAVSSDEELIDSALEEAGVIRLDNFLEFIDMIKAFQLPPMRGRRVMVMSPFGGVSVMGADLCENTGFEFAEMGQEFYDSLQQFSNAGVINFSNPLDMGDIYDPELTAHVIYSVMHSENVDGAMYISQRPQMPPGEDVFQKMFLADLSKETWGAILSGGKPLGVCLFGPSHTIQQAKKAVKFPVFNSPESMVKALYQQMKYYERKRIRDEAPAFQAPEGLKKEEARSWLERRKGDYGEEALELLSAYGIPVAASRLATGEKEAVEKAEELGYPLVMKVVSPQALHKSDAGGVVVGVETPGQVEEYYTLIKRNLQEYREDACLEGVRLQQMAGEGYDMFVGGKQDPSFGPVVFFGMGGVYVEIFKDVANALCPTQEDTVFQRLAQLKSYQLLQGYRGQPPGDITALVDLVVRVSHLMADFSIIQELDLNPVRVFSSGEGVITLDARCRVEK